MTHVKMKINYEPESARRVAKTLGLLASSFMGVVSVVVFYTQDHLTILDYLLILCAPFVFGALAYFVGRYHDSGASD